MSGNIIGGRKAAATNKLRQGEDFFRRIGAAGGRNGKTGGFASKFVGTDGLNGKERARVVGKIGGTISRRKKKL